jgi:hypothetical protein
VELKTLKVSTCGRSKAMRNSLRGVFSVCLYTCFAGLLAIALIALAPADTWAQQIAGGTIAGTVVDNTNAVVPGATVTITQATTGTTRATTTNNVGYYIFVGVDPGTYNVKVTMQGFTTATFTNQVVRVGTALTLNAKLQVGATTTTVEVTSTPGAELQTLNSTVGSTVTSTALNSLPAIGRESDTFFTLQPGISPNGSVAGTVVDNNTFQLDGGNNTNDMDGSMNVYTPSYSNDPTGGLAGGGPTGVMPTPIDSVEEFKINTTNQTADFNNSSGAQVEVVTKRGTNTWHGTAYEYYLDNNFDANTWQNNKNHVALPSYHYSRFGGNLGGAVVPKNVLGGKWYMFGFFQGFRWPNAATITKPVPSPGMEQGLLQYTVNGTPTVFNLNPAATKYTGPSVGGLVNGNTYLPSTACGATGTSLCNPSTTLGISPTMQALWAFEPTPNQVPGTTSACSLGRCTSDPWNVWGFTANMALPQHDNQVVTRIDHDFGAKWHFTGSYRFYKFIRQTSSQVDVGGFFPGDKLGVPSSLSSRPQEPWYYVAGLTTDISSTTTNDFHYSYLRDFWAWGSHDAPPQLSGLGAALEPLGETASPLAPYNVDTQDVRTRFWDGQDNMFRDDVTSLHGNHLFQFGGTYERNYNFHQRSDNGGGINFDPVYRLGQSASSGINMKGFIPVDPTTGNPDVSSTYWTQDYSMVLGIPSITQIAYTRSGANLALNPAGTHAFDQSTIPFYNVYFSDTWHMKPTFTFNYGLGWTLEMPPTEANGKIISLVDQSGQLLDEASYINQRKRAALQGQVYNPEVGFTLIGNSGRGLSRAYNPYYGSFSPRLSAAWNPKFSSGFLQKMFGENATVIRGGYGRIYGRLNGVDLVLVPLLGTGLIQAVQCFDPLNNANGNTCAGTLGATPANAFRIGPTSGGFDGLTPPIPVGSPTLPQPDFPGINAIAAGAGEVLDPNFRPNVVDSFDLSIQRQLAPKVTMELGYIGRRITHEYMPINLNNVPYMFTMGGQTFANAYAQSVLQYCGGVAGLGGGGCTGTGTVSPQPFFEAALGGTSSLYCTGYSSCTAAVVAKEGLSGTGNLVNAQVWSLWSDLDNNCKGTCGKGGFTFDRTMMNTPVTGTFGARGQLTSGIGVNASVGSGNYNAVFATVRTSDWHGVTMGSNFTWSRALGEGAVVQASSEYMPDDPYNLHAMYGMQFYDTPLVFTQYLVYQPPFYSGQKGLIGHILGGWTFSPLFAAGSGFPDEAYPSTGTPAQAFGSGDGVNFFDNENPLFITHVPISHSAYVSPSGTVNMFSNPATVFNALRNPILGLDGNAGGGAILRGLPYWNMDMEIKKEFKITERFSGEIQTIFVNIFNHNQFGDPNLDLSAGPSGFGAIGGQANTPRQMEFGARISF